MDDIYQQIGESGITNMVAAFYKRVRTDEIIGHMYPDDDWEGSEKRLRDFLVFRLGGPDTYIQERGHPRLRMRHAPFRIGELERDRWLQLMDEAMGEVEIPNEPRNQLRVFFAQVADFLRNSPT